MNARCQDLKAKETKAFSTSCRSEGGSLTRPKQLHAVFNGLRVEGSGYSSVYRLASDSTG